MNMRDEGVYEDQSLRPPGTLIGSLLRFKEATGKCRRTSIDIAYS